LKKIDKDPGNEEHWQDAMIPISEILSEKLLFHHCMPAARVQFNKIRADPGLSDPNFLPAYEWLDDELGFFPLFLAVGTSEEAIRMTGYEDNWRVITGSEMVQGRLLKKHRKKGEFPSLALLSFGSIDGVFMDFMSWHIALNACLNGKSVTKAEKSMIFKPSWTKRRWIRAAVQETHAVQLVTPEIPLNLAEMVIVRNSATKRNLEKKGFSRVEAARVRVTSRS
jgi:hypothetical protein